MVDSSDCNIVEAIAAPVDLFIRGKVPDISQGSLLSDPTTFRSSEAMFWATSKSEGGELKLIAVKTKHLATFEFLTRLLLQICVTHDPTTFLLSSGNVLPIIITMSQRI